MKATKPLAVLLLLTLLAGCTPTANTPTATPAATVMPSPSRTTAPILDATSFSGRTVNEVLEEYGALVQLAEDGYQGARYLYLQAPINLTLLFNPKEYEVVAGDEPIVAVSVGQGLTDVAVGIIPRDVTFYQLEELLKAHEGEFDTVSVDEEEHESDTGPLHGAVELSFGEVEVYFAWREATKDQPCDDIMIRRSLSQAWAVAEVEKLMGQIGADSYTAAPDRDDVYTLTKDGVVMGTVYVDNREGTLSLDTGGDVPQLGGAATNPSAALDQFLGTWYVEVPVTWYNGESGTSLLEISFLNYDGLYCSNIQDTRGYYAKNNDIYLPVTVNAQGDFQIDYTTYGDNIQYTLIVRSNPLGQLFLTGTLCGIDFDAVEVTSRQLTSSKEWLNGLYSRYDQSVSTFTGGVDGDMSLSAVTLEDFLRENVYGHWISAEGGVVLSLHSTYSKHYILNARLNFYRDTSVTIEYVYQDDPSTIHTFYWTPDSYAGPTDEWGELNRIHGELRLDEKPFFRTY